MARLKKFEPDQIYVSERLNNRLTSIFTHSVTIIETPTGYGKTTSVREFLKNSGQKYIWFNIDSSDRNQFVSDFCSMLDGIDGVAATFIRQIGYPQDITASSSIANAIIGIEFSEPTVIVLDNYHYIADEHMDNVIKDLSGRKQNNLKIVCLTQTLSSSVTLDLVLKKRLNHIVKTDFQLEKSEISGYYKQCGMKLEPSEVDGLYDYTEGWISALYLLMINYNSTESFEPSLSVENLIMKEIWGNLSLKEQDFLICMCIFEDFSSHQASVISSDIVTEDEMIHLIKNNGFISYDSKKRRYHIHSALKHYLQYEFEKLDTVSKKKIYKSAGDWYAMNNQNYLAMKYYMMIDDYESIIAMNWSKANLGYKISKLNKKMFMDVVASTPYSIKKRYVKNYLVFIVSLFLLNERAYLKKECDIVRDFIDSDNEMNKYEKKELLGELELLYALLSFNDIEKMNKYYIRAFEYLGAPTKLFADKISFDLGCPSILALYHREEGNLEKEIQVMDRTMPDYYRVTDGNSKGVEALMRAEKLLNQGNIEDASILCEKTKYMAESRKQISVYLSALLIESRIMVINADGEKLNKCLDEMRELIEKEQRHELSNMVDLCQGYIHVNLAEPDMIAPWLKENASIEENTSIFNLGYANIIYGRYLLLTEDYNKLMAISGQLLDIAGIFSNVMYKIYTYMYLSIAKSKTNKVDKAVEFLNEAVKLAYKDEIIMPFVELYNDLAPILEQMNLGKDFEVIKEFIDHIKINAKKYTKRLSSVKRATKMDTSYGLTKRELEVAKLAMQRMSNKEIAEALFIAESTVKSNLKVIFNKLSINSRSELKNFFE